MKTKKIITNAAVITAIVGLISFLSCYLIDTASWSWPNLLLSLGVALLQLALGFILVNVFFEKKKEEEEQMRVEEKRLREEEEKQRIKKATSIVLCNSVAKFITEFSMTILNNFKWSEYVDKVKNKIIKNLNVDEIDSETIEKYIDAIKENYTVLFNDMNTCLQQINIIVSTGILNEDNELLTQYLAANKFWNSLNNNSIDDSNNYRKIVLDFEAFVLAITNVAIEYSPEFTEKYLQPYMETVFSK